MYEIETDGTPISPVFTTAHALAVWMTENNPDESHAPYDARVAQIKKDLFLWMNMGASEAGAHKLADTIGVEEAKRQLVALCAKAPHGSVTANAQ